MKIFSRHFNSTYCHLVVSFEEHEPLTQQPWILNNVLNGHHGRGFNYINRPLTRLITGCSSGIGLTLARMVQSNGYRVIATSRNPYNLPDIVSEIRCAGGQWIQLDVNDRNCGDVIDGIERNGQGIDILVNNAGSCIYSPVECFTEDEVRIQIETQFFGPALLIRAALPYMRQHRSGVIVNISSGAALESNPTMGAYAGGKAALDGKPCVINTRHLAYSLLAISFYIIGMSETLEKEVSCFNIRVLTVQLGTFNTGMLGAVTLGKNALPLDYKNTVSESMMSILSSVKFVPKGYKYKASKVIYEVVVGEGIGKRRENEKLLPLGQDLSAGIKALQD